jgi:hypothetical protein
MGSPKIEREDKDQGDDGSGTDNYRQYVKHFLNILCTTFRYMSENERKFNDKLEACSC